MKNPESVAEHIFRTALMCMFLAKGRDLNMEKILKMAIIHDLAEARIGDIVTANDRELKKRISRDEKLRMEQKAFKEMTAPLNDNEAYNLWLEFEEGKTKEAKFVKQVEKLEMSMQALEYERDGNRNVKRHFHGETEVVEDRRLKKFFNEMFHLMRNKK